MTEHQVEGQDCDYALSMPAVLESVELFQDALPHFWRSHPDVDRKVRTALERAAVEILVNIVRHAFELDAARSPETSDSQRRLDVMLARPAGRVVIELVDNGQPAEIDLSSVGLPDDESESGRGLAMALEALDELDYERSDGRNRWRLTCLTS